jgi:hypothetical protein
MANNPNVTLVLIVGGMVFILASICGVAYLYHVHAETFAVPHEGPGLDNFGMFLVGVGVPAAVGVVVGAILLTIGIKRHTGEPH